ncbi:tyrosine-type recombinase/integrase [Vibrio sp. S11_S32]|uniref:tyrosine-type recombinase/integrase n=1 Tax=Vibrio sp. S11_S32 TaxID=2720225 RepID=UPI001681AB6B|nr:tyrosine-type recombinase/integrase [Vibrio sp. S11_S32]MBD1576753.1 tyrosine-type recombinase/integrase [Vibrio sp. S11_S32]
MKLIKKHLDAIERNGKLVQYTEDSLTFRMTPAGHKSWQFRYKSPVTHKIRLLKIADYHILTITQARSICRDLLAQVAEGRDPHISKGGNIPTLNECFERWLVVSKFSPRTERTYRNIWGNHAGYLKSALYTKIDRRMVIDYARANIESHDLKRFFYTIIAGVTKWCESEYLDIDSSQFQGLLKLERKPDTKEMKYITADRLPEFIGGVSKCGLDDNRKIATLLLLVWGVRIQSLLNMKWGDIDLAGGVATIYETKVNTVVRIHITELVKGWFESMQNGRQQPDHYIFHARRNLEKPRDRQFITSVYDAINETETTPHRLRYTFSSVLNTAGFDPLMIETCLSHKVMSDISRIYNKADYLEQRKPIYQYMSDLVQCGGYIERVEIVEEVNKEWHQRRLKL